MALLSSQDQALRLDEILDAVFGAMDKASLASCARVCRHWEASASRSLWRDLGDVSQGLKPLAMLLGELDLEATCLVCTVVHISST